MKHKSKPYEIAQEFSDLVNEPQFNLFFNNGENERQEDGTLRVLSLFSGCGGMDLGLEGGFICHRKSVTNEDFIHHAVNEDWVMLKRNVFRTVFACDILEEARLTWLRYMSRFNINPDIYHLDSIVDLVKLQREGHDIFPHNIDIVTGGFPCQDFSVAGKRKGFDSAVSHNGEKRTDDRPSEETRGKLYIWMKQVIDMVQP
jgi:DNA (cytosine-5)-methyltransferase 1